VAQPVVSDAALCNILLEALTALDQPIEPLFVDDLLAGIASGPGQLLELHAPALHCLVYRHGNELALDLVLVHAPIGARDDDLRKATTIIADWPAPKLPVGGHDLMALGIEPGASLGRWLALVESWWIAGDFTADRSACLDWLKVQRALS